MNKGYSTAHNLSIRVSRSTGLSRRLFSPPRSLTDLQINLVCALCLALGGFVLYALTAVAGPFNGDSGEFQYMPRLLGLPHPTGYPTYLLLGWLWSWLPLGTMAFRMNLFSSFWAALTLALLYMLARQQGLKQVAAVSGVIALGLTAPFWRYAGLASVYTLHTVLLTAAFGSWLCWSAASVRSARKWLRVAALFTGVALTNHPTAAFLVPAVMVFVVLRGLSQWLPRTKLSLQNLRESSDKRAHMRASLAAFAFFLLPGLLYLYVPLRLWAIGPGLQQFGLQESIAKGRVSPLVDSTTEGVLRYILGSDFLGSYHADWSLLCTRLPDLLVELFGVPLVMLGVLGAVLWLVRRRSSGIMLLVFFLLAAASALAYDASYAARDEIVHLTGHLMSALLVFTLWIAEGVNTGLRIALRLLRHTWLVYGVAGLLLIPALAVRLVGTDVPTTADRIQSESIRDYWEEALSYPLEIESALTGHWGDLTAFWYFQHGEGVRPDLWAIFPPNNRELRAWLARSGRPVYLVGPLLNWSPDLAERYDLTPWGILVRIDPRDNPPTLPLMRPKTALFGDRLQLNGYDVMFPAAGRCQLWLAWRTTASTSRDLSVSVRLHAPNGALLLQKDGRLASPWFPEVIMPKDQELLTVLELEVSDELPFGILVRIVVYDPLTLEPLLTGEGQDVFELGRISSE